MKYIKSNNNDIPIQDLIEEEEIQKKKNTTKKI